MEAENDTPASKVDDSQLSQGNDYEHLSLFRTAVNKKTTDKSVKPYCCAVTLNTTPTIMEIDTGATLSIISTHQIDLLKENGHQLEMETNNLPVLRTYSGENMQPEGRVHLQVGYNDKTYQLRVWLSKELDQISLDVIG